LVVSGIRIVPGIQGTVFVAFPSYKAGNGQYRDIIQIEDAMLDREVKEEILRQYYAKIDFNPFLPIFADEKPETDKKQR
jgi:DNA-binding cell septation regulator SpoVG